MPDAPKRTPSPQAGNPVGRNIAIFAAICVVTLAVAGIFVVRSAQSSAGGVRDASADVPLLSVDQVLGAAGRLVFLDTIDIADTNRAIAVQLGTPDSAREVISEPCQRVAMAAGRGLCLTLGHDLSRGSAFIFDADYRVTHLVPASGLPSRTRVSADGRYGSMTFFIFGHAYSGGAFSTRSDIVEMETGKIVDQLEDFSVEKDGKKFKEDDFNFWGVTFSATDSNHFYATLGSGGKTYLVEGDIAARKLKTLRENVECPSLSPDGTRIAFKKKVSEEQGKEWRLAVLDLATMQERMLPETRSVDDQVEWLDNGHLLYSPPTPTPEIWMLAVDGSGVPARFLTHAFSPSVQR